MVQGGTQEGGFSEEKVNLGKRNGMEGINKELRDQVALSPQPLVSLEAPHLFQGPNPAEPVKAKAKRGQSRKALANPQEATLSFFPYSCPQSPLLLISFPGLARRLLAVAGNVLELGRPTSALRRR